MTRGSAGSASVQRGTPSSPAAASRVPSGENVTWSNFCFWAVRTCIDLPLGNPGGSHVHVPDDDLAGVRADGGAGAVRAERDAPQPADLPGERAGELPRRGVVELHRLVVARRREQAAGGVERDRGPFKTHY